MGNILDREVFDPNKPAYVDWQIISPVRRIEMGLSVISFTANITGNIGGRKSKKHTPVFAVDLDGTRTQHKSLRLAAEALNMSPDTVWKTSKGYSSKLVSVIKSLECVTVTRLAEDGASSTPKAVSVVYQGREISHFDTSREFCTYVGKSTNYTSYLTKRPDSAPIFSKLVGNKYIVYCSEILKGVEE
jgi:superfamily I DNA/RNA helicase